MHTLQLRLAKAMTPTPPPAADVTTTAVSDEPLERTVEELAVALADRQAAIDVAQQQAAVLEARCSLQHDEIASLKAQLNVSNRAK